MKPSTKMMKLLDKFRKHYPNFDQYEIKRISNSLEYFDEYSRLDVNRDTYDVSIENFTDGYYYVIITAHRGQHEQRTKASNGM
jgi:hypothetical protein